MPEDAVPEELDQSVTGPFHITSASRGRVLSWVRVVFAILLAGLLVANIALYSLLQAVRARVEGQDHRMERLSKMIDDMIAANQNAEKIEAMSQKIDGIDTQVQDLASTLKSDASKDQEALEDPKSAPSLR